MLFIVRNAALGSNTYIAEPFLLGIPAANIIARKCVLCQLGSFVSNVDIR